MGRRRRSRIPGSPTPLRRARRGRLVRLILLLRRRSDEGDHVVQGSGFAGYPGIRTYASGHRDQPLSDRGRVVFWSVLALIVIGSAIGIALTK